MAVLLDPPLWPAHGTLWSHVVSDTSLAELHRFAVEAGLPARSFDLDHYDAPASRYEELLACGARPVDAGTLIRRLRASGLRLTERTRTSDVGALRSRWASLAPVGADDVAWRAVGDALVARWGEKGRLHHGHRHLREVLDAVELLAHDDESTAAPSSPISLSGPTVQAPGPVPVPAPVPDASPSHVLTASLAAWFHDAVHSSGRRRDSPLPDGVPDEQASAELASSLLTGLVEREVRDDVVRLVLMTATHRPDEDDDVAALLSDADLAVLGADPVRYADYAAAIRAEYAHVPEHVFRPGRAAILEALLDGDLFHTTAGRRRWNARARTNLTDEISTLRA